MTVVVTIKGTVRSVVPATPFPPSPTPPDLLVMIETEKGDVVTLRTPGSVSQFMLGQQVEISIAK